MAENLNTKTLDIAGLRWGEAPVPVLPDSLRITWRDEALPNWLIAECGLTSVATIDALGPRYWERRTQISSRLEHFVEFLIKSREKSIELLPVFDRPWPVGLEVTDIPYSSRATNALSSSGLLADKEALGKVTFGKLIAIPNIGIKSLIEIATLTEAAIELHRRITAGLAKSFAAAATYEASDNITSPIASDAAAYDASISTDGWNEVLSAALELPWVDQIDEHDPRFGKLLAPGYGTLEDRIDRAISDPAGHSAEIPALVASLPRVKAAVERQAAQSLEDNLLELLAIFESNEEPRFSALAARFGWLGNDSKTLQECGNMIGVTRERIRQIEARLIRKLTAHPIYLPNLDTALAILEAAAPIHAARAATLLVEKGLCRHPFSPHSLIDTARLFGRKTSLAVEDHRGERIVVSGEQGQALGVLTRTARKLAGQSGVTSVYKVVDAIVESFAPLDPPTINEDDVRRILKHQPGSEFLDEDWFWDTAIPEGRNRLENITKKVLSVVSPQTVASIREGVRRTFRWRFSTNQRYRTLTVPPQAVLAKFLERHPDFHIDGELVSSVKPLNYRRLLGDGEQVLVDVLRGLSPGVVDRQTLVRECLARGINENTLAVYTTYSPILEHLSVGLWKLRGVRVDPAVVEAVREQNVLRPREIRVQNFGWTIDGRLWVAWKLPPIASNPVLSIPAPIKRYLMTQTFDAQPKDVERNVGRIAINDAGLSYGYAPFFRYCGADEGDTLRAEFDLAHVRVHLSLNEDVEEDAH